MPCAYCPFRNVPASYWSILPSMGNPACTSAGMQERESQFGRREEQQVTQQEKLDRMQAALERQTADAQVAQAANEADQSHLQVAREPALSEDDAIGAQKVMSRFLQLTLQQQVNASTIRYSDPTLLVRQDWVTAPWWHTEAAGRGAHRVFTSMSSMESGGA